MKMKWLLGFQISILQYFQTLKSTRMKVEPLPSVVTVKKPVYFIGVKCRSLSWAHSGSAPFESCYSLSWQESHQKQPFRLGLMWSLLFNSAWADTGKWLWKDVPVLWAVDINLRYPDSEPRMLPEPAFVRMQSEKPKAEPAKNPVGI